MRQWIGPTLVQLSPSWCQDIFAINQNSLLIGHSGTNVLNVMPFVYSYTILLPFPGHTPLPEVSSAIYQAGFRECAAEVVRYLGTHGNHDTGVKSRLSQHLSHCAPRSEMAYRFPQNETTPLRTNAYQLTQPIIPEATRLSSLPGRTYQLSALHPVMSGSDNRDNVKLETSPRSGFLTPPASPIRENSPPEIIKPVPSCHSLSLQISIPHQYSVAQQNKPLGFSRHHPVKRLQHRPIIEHQHVDLAEHRRMWRPWWIASLQNWLLQFCLQLRRNSMIFFFIFYTFWINHCVLTPYLLHHDTLHSVSILTLVVRYLLMNCLLCKCTKQCEIFIIYTLQWRQNGRDSVSNHQPHHCVPNRYSGANQRKHQS